MGLTPEGRTVGRLVAINLIAIGFLGSPLETPVMEKTGNWAFFFKTQNFVHSRCKGLTLTLNDTVIFAIKFSIFFSEKLVEVSAKPIANIK